MGGAIWTDNAGNICTMPVEYTYVGNNKLWYVEYNYLIRTSGATFTMFIETGANTDQGSIRVNANSSVTMKLLELPTSGSLGASIPDTYTGLTVYNLNRYPTGVTTNLTKIKIDDAGTWTAGEKATTLQTMIGGDEYPIDSINSRAYWVLDSSATYAINIESSAALNNVVLSYTWNETSV